MLHWVSPVASPDFVQSFAVFTAAILHCIFQLHSLGVTLSTLGVTSATAESYRFSAFEHFSQEVALTAASVRLGDGALVLLDENSTFGKEEFCKYVTDLVNA